VWVARLFTAAVIGTIVSTVVTDDTRPLLVVLVAQTLFTWPQLRRIERVLRRADAVTRDLDTLKRLLSRIEAESFTAPRLRELQQQLNSGTSASAAIRRLHWLVEIHEWQHNSAFLVLTMPLLVGTHIAGPSVMKPPWRLRRPMADCGWRVRALASLCLSV
jgi:hypothetical protein